MPPAAPQLTYVTRIALDVGVPVDLGPAPDRHRRIVPILGGTVDGPLLRGRVLPVDADHQTLRTPTCTELDAGARHELQVVLDIFRVE